MSTPEQVRDYDNEESMDVSNMDGDRNISIVSVPCSNSFEALASLENDGTSTSERTDTDSQLQPLPAVSCKVCYVQPQPITSTDYFRIKYPVCRILECTKKFDQRQYVKCECDTTCRFVCTDCLSRSDIHEWCYERNQ